MIDFSNLSWSEMEQLVGELFRKKGYDVKVTQKTGDFGIDVEAKNSVEFIGIQVKHWKNDVGFDDCAKTLGVSHKYNKAIIISTRSGFTPQAWKFQEENRYRLELWDTHRFRKELDSLGISTDFDQPVTSYKKDTRNKIESKQPMSISALVSLLFFGTGIILLVFPDFYPETSFLGIPFLAIAILIISIKKLLHR